MSTSNQNYPGLIARACRKNVDAKEIAGELWYSLYRDKQLGHLDQIFIQARDILARENQEIEAEVISKDALLPEQLAEIEATLKNHYQEKILINNIIDKTLGAGIEVKIAGKIYDFSLKGKILQLEKKLKEKYEV